MKNVSKGTIESDYVYIWKLSLISLALFLREILHFIIYLLEMQIIQSATTVVLVVNYIEWYV